LVAGVDQLLEGPACSETKADAATSVLVFSVQC
jgi:hypothetical protein